MAKKSIGINYKNGEISVNDDGDFILTEVTKDDIKSYNLTTLLNSLVGQSIDLGLKTVDELPPDAESEDFE